MRIMALDYGTRSIGVAISDELQITVRPLTTLSADAWLIERIMALVIEYEVGTVVVGLPLRMDGTRGEAAERTEIFVRKLQSQLSIPIVMRDERLTSHAADELLRERGASLRERRARSDEYAAAIILQDYLAEQEQVDNLI